jgi:ABC-type Fe3+/spermidine/putrescine transport system ATPase subunit
VFSRPASGWVASFLDLGNVLDGKWLDGGWVETSLGVLAVDHQTEAGLGEAVTLLIRPERVQITKNNRGLKGQVVDVIFQKNGFRVTLTNGLYFYTPIELQIGEEIFFTVEAECLV